MSDYLALCPLCRRAVGLLSRRVRMAERQRRVIKLLTPDVGDECRHHQVVQPATPEMILAKWVRAGLVIERFDGEPPEVIGHVSGCTWKAKAKAA